MNRINCGIYSAKTNIPYRAGKLAAKHSARQIFGKNPAICLVFFSPRYASPDLVEGVVQTIPADVVAGCSTNGEIASGYWRETVIAIAISTDYMRFGIAAESNDTLASGSKAIYRQFYERALKDLRDKMVFHDSSMFVPINPKSITPDFGMIFLPGTDIESNPKANDVIIGLREFAGNLPLIGGICGDDFNYERGYVIFKDEFLEDHTLLILGRSDLEISMAQKHGYHIKQEFTLTESHQNSLLSINNQPASEAYFGSLNLPVVEINDLRDEICALNPLAIKEEGNANLQVLFPMSRGRNASSLTVSQSIPQGSKIYLAEADVEESKKASLESVKAAFSSGVVKDPQVGLIFSCVGRSTFYFNRASAEIEEIKNRFKYTDFGGAYLNGTICESSNWVSEGTTSTLLIGNNFKKRFKQ